MAPAERPCLTGRQADRPDSCRPALCALGGTPHIHCPCGLPMAAGATLCDLCLAEELQIDVTARPASRTEWDSNRYPSLRLNRPTDVPVDRYDALLRAIFGTAPGQARQPTTGAAA